MRQSYINRVFTTMVDYNVESYEKLVTPTVKIFANAHDTKLYKDLKRDHNNVSHTERFGAIRLKGGKYELTPVGQRLFHEPSLFNGMFNEQALAFSFQYNKKVLFPYRAMLKLMYKLDSLNQFEFVVSPFLLRGTSPKDIQDALDRIKLLRHLYGDISKKSDAQKSVILDDVNLRFGLDLVFKDVWTSETAAYNQFRYFGNHLSNLVQGIRQQGGEIVKKRTSTNAEIQSLLLATASVESLSGNPGGLNSYFRS